MLPLPYLHGHRSIVPASFGRSTALLRRVFGAHAGAVRLLGADWLISDDDQKKVGKTLKNQLWLLVYCTDYTILYDTII